MKNKAFYKIQLVVLFTILFQNMGMACRCDTTPAFCKVVNENHKIIRGIVIDQPEIEFMRIKVIENINNEITEDTIIVFGQDGVNCGELLWQFDINDNLILALKELDSSDNYYLNGCGFFYLKYENEMVTGKITDDLTSQSYQDFKENIFECLSINNFIISPNPVGNTMVIRTRKGAIEGWVEIFKSNGQLIFQKPKDVIYFTSINTENFASGVYIIRIHSSTGTTIKKFIKM